MAANLGPKALRGGVPGTGRHIPQRSCVACGKKLSKHQLIRIVRTPQGAVTVDPSGKRAGRGAYLCGSKACWTRAISKGGLARGLKVNLSAQDGAQLLEFYETQATGPSSKVN